MNIIVSEKAKLQLTEHIHFLAQVDKDAARNLKNNFLEAFQSLEQLSERFPLLYDDLIPKNKYRKMLVEKRYIVLYQLKNSTVFIDYILDCRQGYSWLL